MGVNTYLLDRRPIPLLIGDTRHTVGALRRYFKVTELDDERAAELNAAACIRPSPVAAMIMDITELPIAGERDKPVAAHLVLGWDDGRGSVTDFDWDYLPILGYGVRNPENGAFTLYEERAGTLYQLDQKRAGELGLVGPEGHLARRGQPTISECRSVRPYIAGYAEADCTFDDGRKLKLLVALADAALPEPAWLIGKKPFQAVRYPPDRSVPREPTKARKFGDDPGPRSRL